MWGLEAVDGSGFVLDPWLAELSFTSSEQAVTTPMALGAWLRSCNP
jgi:hypothetical protein